MLTLILNALVYERLQPGGATREQGLSFLSHRCAEHNLVGPPLNLFSAGDLLVIGVLSGDKVASSGRELLALALIFMTLCFFFIKYTYLFACV